MEMIPIISLSGSPFEMGRQFGSAFRKQVHSFALARMGHLKKVGEDCLGKAINNHDMLRLAASTLVWHRSYDENVWDEFCGIAKGAGISYALLLIGMGFTDLQDYLLRSAGVTSSNQSQPSGCSAFILPANLSTKGVLIGQTWDMSPEAIKYLVMVKRKPDNAPETLYLTTAGCLALIGLNGEGIAIGTTNLSTSDHAEGVNYLFTISSALQKKELKGAVTSIINSRRLSGHNFLLGDPYLGINIEASATKAEYQSSLTSVICHTNHCLAPQIKKLELPRHELVVQSSHTRLNRLNGLFDKQNNLLDIYDCWSILSGMAVLAPPNGATYNSANLFATVATCLLCPKDRTLWYCAGKAEYENMLKISL